MENNLEVEFNSNRVCCVHFRKAWIHLFSPIYWQNGRAKFLDLGKQTFKENDCFTVSHCNLVFAEILGILSNLILPISYNSLTDFSPVFTHLFFIFVGHFFFLFQAYCLMSSIMKLCCLLWLTQMCLLFLTLPFYLYLLPNLDMLNGNN